MWILDGPLGAGKTALARRIGAGLGVLGRVSSPTFIIARNTGPGGPGGRGWARGRIPARWSG